MTLVAGFLSSGTPILLGDFLVSSPNGDHLPGRSFHGRLPTVSEKDLNAILPPDQKRRVSGVVQKIYRISDCLAVGVCGLAFFAGPILKQLREQQSEIHNLDTLRKNLENIRQDIGHGQCGLIGWIIEKGVPKSFHWSNEGGTFDVVSPPAVDGTGENYFRYLINGIKEFNNPADPLLRAVALAGQMTGWEVTLGSSLHALFGGGSQIIYFEGSNFRNLRDVTFLFFEVDEVTEGRITPHFHHRILKYQYEEELVLIQTENLGELQKTDASSFVGGSSSTEVHVVPPLYRTPLECESLYKTNSLLQSSNSKKLSYASAYFCAYATIHHLNGTDGYFVHVIPNDGHQQQILVERVEGGEDITLTNRFFQEFFRGIVQVHR